MEAMYAVSRGEAIGETLSTVFPAEFAMRSISSATSRAFTTCTSSG